MNFSVQSALSNFRQKNGELLIGGRSVSSIADHYGTPAYIYDRLAIKRRHQKLRSALPRDLNIYYSVKANPNLEILNTSEIIPIFNLKEFIFFQAHRIFMQTSFFSILKIYWNTQVIFRFLKILN
jgi:hypothetical protein